jgi:hypothetical protein
MSDDTMRLAGDIGWGLAEHFCNAYRHRINGQEYDMPEDDQWEALGEDPGATDCPIILVRKSDGKFFEVDIEVTVKETSPEQREKDREYYKSMWARHHPEAV